MHVFNLQFIVDTSVSLFNLFMTARCRQVEGQVSVSHASHYKSDICMMQIPSKGLDSNQVTWRRF
jgi:hypothetical protein